MRRLAGIVTSMFLYRGESPIKKLRGGGTKGSEHGRNVSFLAPIGNPTPTKHSRNLLSNFSSNCAIELANLYATFHLGMDLAGVGKDLRPSGHQDPGG